MRPHHHHFRRCISHKACFWHQACCCPTGWAAAAAYRRLQPGRLRQEAAPVGRPFGCFVQRPRRRSKAWCSPKAQQAAVIGIQQTTLALATWRRVLWGALCGGPLPPKQDAKAQQPRRKDACPTQAPRSVARAHRWAVASACAAAAGESGLPHAGEQASTGDCAQDLQFTGLTLCH